MTIFYLTTQINENCVGRNIGSIQHNNPPHISLSTSDQADKCDLSGEQHGVHAASSPQFPWLNLKKQITEICLVRNRGYTFYLILTKFSSSCLSFLWKVLGRLSVQIFIRLYGIFKAHRCVRCSLMSSQRM